MTKEEIERTKASIKNSEEILAKGLIIDPDAASQLRRMIYYYEQKIKEAETDGQIQDTTQKAD